MKCPATRSVTRFVRAGILMMIVLCLGSALAQDAATHYQNGYIFFSQEDYERSAEQYRLALELDPDFHDARYWLGKALEQQGDIQGALNEWVQVLVANPGHADTFGKWRYYAPSYARLESQEVERLYRALVEQTEPVAITRQQAFQRVLPYGFVMLNRAENFSSLYLAARLFRWAGNEIGSLFWQFSYTGYRRALDYLIDHQVQPTPEIYTFLLDTRIRYPGDSDMMGRVDRLLEISFAHQAGIEVEQGEEVEILEIKVTPEKISIDAGGPNISQFQTGGPEASFYIESETEQQEETPG